MSDSTNQTTGQMVPTGLPGGRLQVGELALKLHGVDRAGARRISERAMQLASERIPADANGSFDSLQLRVRPRRYTEAGVSEAIAEAIVRAVTGREEDDRA